MAITQLLRGQNGPRECHQEHQRSMHNSHSVPPRQLHRGKRGECVTRPWWGTDLDLYAIPQSVSSSESPTVMLLVTHATAIRITATGLLGIPLTVARSFAQENAAVNVIERRPERNILRLWNDTTHCAGIYKPLSS